MLGFFGKGCARPPPFVVNAGRDNFLDGPYPVLGQKNAREPGFTPGSRVVGRRRGGRRMGQRGRTAGAAAVLRRKGWR